MGGPGSGRRKGGKKSNMVDSMRQAKAIRKATGKWPEGGVRIHRKKVSK